MIYLSHQREGQCKNTGKKVLLTVFCRQWIHQFLQIVAPSYNHDLTSVSCTYAGYVLFLSVRRSSASQSNICVSLFQLLLKLEWGGCNAERKVTGGSGMLFFVTSVAVVCLFFSVWETQGSHRRLLIFIITDTAVAEALNHKTSSIFSMYRVGGP